VTNARLAGLIAVLSALGVVAAAGSARAGTASPLDPFRRLGAPSARGGALDPIRVADTSAAPTLLSAAP